MEKIESDAVGARTSAAWAILSLIVGEGDRTRECFCWFSSHPRLQTHGADEIGRRKSVGKSVGLADGAYSDIVIDKFPLIGTLW
jgi:hypothetical protein